MSTPTTDLAALRGRLAALLADFDERYGIHTVNGQLLRDCASALAELADERDEWRDKAIATNEKLSYAEMVWTNCDEERVGYLKRAEAAEAEATELEERAQGAEKAADLLDKLRNGIEERDDGTLTLIWTKREVDQIKDEAVEIARSLGVTEEYVLEADRLRAETAAALHAQAEAERERDNAKASDAAACKRFEAYCEITNDAVMEAAELRDARDNACAESARLREALTKRAVEHVYTEEWAAGIQYHRCNVCNGRSPELPGNELYPHTPADVVHRVGCPLSPPTAAAAAWIASREAEVRREERERCAQIAEEAFANGRIIMSTTWPKQAQVAGEKIAAKLRAAEAPEPNTEAKQ